MPGRFRFSRDGVEFSGKTETFGGVVRARFYLADEGQQIADALSTVLRASVGLYDEERREHHHAANGPHPGRSLRGVITMPKGACSVRARINSRWTLMVFGRRRLHPDAESLARWAARKLEPHVPDKTADAEEPQPPPTGGGGGSGGSAEIGIPVWWARKARN